MIKELFAKLVVVSALAVLLGGYPAPQPSEPAPSEEPTVLEESVKQEPEKGNWLNLTPEQRRKDFDYLYQTLKENYPYFHVVQRMTGKDMEKLYQEYREKVKTCRTDPEFFEILDQFTREAESIGHLSTISPLEYPFFKEKLQWIEREFQEEYEKLLDYEEVNHELDHIQRISEAFFNERTTFCYEKMIEYYDSLEEENSQAGSVPQNRDEPPQDKPPKSSNVETKILEPGKIAYIKIKSFDMTGYEQDKKVLFDFYGQVKDYPHVIFDLSRNGGGGSSYFKDLIAAPNIDKPLSTDVYMFMKAGDYNRKYMDFSEFRPISEALSLPRMNPDDFAEFDMYMPQTCQVEPLSSEKMLKGKLWMLVSGRVFSASEYAAIFSKATGFAELVGTTTRGDGIGIDPNFIVLPNSGFLARYSPIYGATSDGASNQEFGTEPDIISPEGETPLDTCLKEIAKLG